MDSGGVCVRHSSSFSSQLISPYIHSFRIRSSAYNVGFSFGIQEGIPFQDLVLPHSLLCSSSCLLQHFHFQVEFACGLVGRMDHVATLLMACLAFHSPQNITENGNLGNPSEECNPSGSILTEKKPINGLAWPGAGRRRSQAW